MSLKKTFGLAVVAALVATGAATPTWAQKRRASAARKTTAPQSVAPAEPAPAKKNRRADESQPSQSQAAQTTVGGASSGEPAKKNAASRPAEQSDAAANTGASGGADAARYAYEFRQPEFDVRRVLIEHDAAGRGRITFERKNEDQPITEPLEISPSAFARIVSAWQALNFLDSEASYQSDKHFANLGTIKLTMRRGARERSTEFDWTNNEQAAALRREYQRLSDQQLFAFDIGVARQYQPSETVKVLKRLEILLDHDDLSDKSQLAPLLSDLSTDERIPLIARNQAARLLKRIEKDKK
ncbi:MAG: hypothetical protein ABR563_09730 [Pyrinomonadaceae bacterium]